MKSLLPEEREMLFMVRVAVPSLNIVVVRSLVFPTVTVPNPMPEIGVLMSGSGSISPVPVMLKETVGSSGSFELTYTVVLFAPADDGANRNGMVSEPEAGIVTGGDGPT